MSGERTLTYAELDSRADRFASGLRRLGVGRGDRVVLVMPNRPDTAIAVYGTARAGAAFTPVGPGITKPKLRAVVELLGSRLVVCDRSAGDLVEAAVGGDSVQAADAAELADAAPDPDDALTAMLDPDLAAVLHTSGSSGEPKGVTLTHGNMSFVADSIVESIGMRGSDRILCVLPLSFGYGLYQLLTCIRIGATLVLEEGFGAASGIIDALEGRRATGFAAVPTIFQLLLSYGGLKQRDLPDLRFMTNAGAGLPVPVVRSIREQLPAVELHLMYGQTECQRVCALPPGEVDSRPGSVGFAIPGTEAWVETADGEPAGPEVVGELMVRGAHVMQGYWGNEEATGRRLRPGRWPWERILATGDLFKTDAEGFLYFVGRRDDIIKSRGQKVPPKEVEDALHAYPGVRDAAVVGAPDPLLGEAVHAHVTPRPGADLDPVAIRRHCASLLESHMVPQRVIVHDELPRIGSGKIDRRRLSELGGDKRLRRP